jgi:hypothetical protein
MKAAGFSTQPTVFTDQKPVEERISRLAHHSATAKCACFQVILLTQIPGLGER